MQARGPRLPSARSRGGGHDEAGPFGVPPPRRRVLPRPRSSRRRAAMPARHRRRPLRQGRDGARQQHVRGALDISWWVKEGSCVASCAEPPRADGNGRAASYRRVPDPPQRTGPRLPILAA
jgi:hypothetical protein